MVLRNCPPHPYLREKIDLPKYTSMKIVLLPQSIVAATGISWLHSIIIQKMTLRGDSSSEVAVIVDQTPWIFPFDYVFQQCYPFVRLLPLAMAKPKEGTYKDEKAFKILFFPNGADRNVHEVLAWDPKFKKGGFLSNASQFMKSRFSGRSDVPFSELLQEQSSIWIVALVKEKKKWYHQIVGGVLYSYSLEGLATAFIHHIAVQEPEHDQVFTPP